jgi:hypothetical protein
MDERPRWDEDVKPEARVWLSESIGARVRSVAERGLSGWSKRGDEREDVGRVQRVRLSRNGGA